VNKTIGFFTGARSDYGIMKRLIAAVANSQQYDYSLYVSGLHLLKNFGYTVDEIKNDGFDIKAAIQVYQEDTEPGQQEFTTLISKLATLLENEKPDVMFILGDRSEAYAAAIACHFAGVKIIHSGGGTLTKGAVDNIYRYNISNLSDIIFATSKGSYERLFKAPILSEKELIFTGSLAIDAIKKFQVDPKPIVDFVPEIASKAYILMTFHPVTRSGEAIEEAMNDSIKAIIEKGGTVLVTYPNNDPGYPNILEVIEKWSGHEQVVVRKNLGAQGYYAALNACSFVIGNSSSGLMEAPYFNKPVINIGSRQQGREYDENITNVECNSLAIRSVIDLGYEEGWPETKCQQIYGKGHALERIMDYFETSLLIQN
jgi:UDP-hydrolysing UDP-N-acetyl-D-glucosamine 2-epimerase